MRRHCMIRNCQGVKITNEVTLIGLDLGGCSPSLLRVYTQSPNPLRQGSYSSPIYSCLCPSSFPCSHPARTQPLQQQLPLSMEQRQMRRHNFQPAMNSRGDKRAGALPLVCFGPRNGCQLGLKRIERKQKDGWGDVEDKVRCGCGSRGIK